MDKRIFWPFSTSTVSEWPGTRPAGWADHVGTDFAVPQGTPLRATISGTVYLTWDDGYGAYVLDIVRPDGFVVRNGHLSYMAVANGSWVNAGDYIGNTGGAAGTPGAGLSTGPHLHWELRWNINWSGPGWVDPRDLSIQSFGAAPSGDKKPVKKRRTEANQARKKREKMIFVFKRDATVKGNGARYGVFVLGQKGTWWEFTGQSSANQLADQLGSAMELSASTWDERKKKHQ